MKIPSAVPYVSGGLDSIHDGSQVVACKFCKDAFVNKPQCKAHYASLLSKPEGFYECPFGFTTRVFYFSARFYAFTGLIAFPRFESARERVRSKENSANKVTRDSLNIARGYFAELDAMKADYQADAHKNLPQALHELRKFNATIKQNAELLEVKYPSEQMIRNVHSASELMTNSFDVIEALTNLEVLKTLPCDQYIDLRGLAYKTKKIYMERARDRSINISVGGDAVGALGSQKTMPIVLSVLIENAIKYGRDNSVVDVRTRRDGNLAVLEVLNATDLAMDPARCFERGARFASSIEGSGLGLYLAKEIVAAHSGTLACESEDQRVCMRLVLPIYLEPSVRNRR